MITGCDNPVDSEQEARKRRFDVLEATSQEEGPPQERCEPRQPSAVLRKSCGRADKSRSERPYRKAPIRPLDRSVRSAAPPRGRARRTTPSRTAASPSSPRCSSARQCTSRTSLLPVSAAAWPAVAGEERQCAEQRHGLPAWSLAGTPGTALFPLTHPAAPFPWPRPVRAAARPSATRRTAVRRSPSVPRPPCRRRPPDVGGDAAIKRRHQYSDGVTPLPAVPCTMPHVGCR
ncbi:hypothetical protein FHS41_000900 [Streptomyces violarus]|uniref:Uncharacterized protein n=1 Tax=Streptomyces violarus TaxID=67380 RepID=A0A7W5EZG5_9ACTN|nr:hypothetical protein [Streptomyces violarus]